jgi:hypothetical protein
VEDLATAKAARVTEAKPSAAEMDELLAEDAEVF